MNNNDSSLTIGSATFGMDVNGTNAYIQSLKTEVFGKAAKEMNDGVETFCKDVPKYWIGASANKFVEEIKHGVSLLSSLVEVQVDVLVDGLNTARENLQKVDQNISIDGNLM